MSMNFATAGQADKKMIMKQSELKINRNFKKDLYKGSLEVGNQSNIALPSVEGKVQMNQTFELVKDGKTKGGDSVGDLSSSYAFYQNQESSLMTAGAPASLSQNMLEKIASKGHQQTYSLAIDGTSSAKGVRAKLASNQRGSQPAYMMTAEDMGQPQTRQGSNLLQFQRNSSTVEKPRGSLQVNNGKIASTDALMQLPKRGGSVMMDSIDNNMILQNLYQSSQQSTKLLHGGNSIRGDGGGYSSLNILPVIGSEQSLDQVNSSHQSRLNSKVELSKRDIQNFLVNGSVSKEFINSNKSQLQKFIRNQARSTDNGFKGYQEYGDKKKNYDGGKILQNRTIEDLHAEASSLVDDLPRDPLGSIQVSPSIQRKLVGPSTIHIEDPSKKRIRMVNSQQKIRSERLNTEAMVFPNDVKLEKKFKGDKSQVSNRVLETWINETLTDAFHLEIPGVLTKPEHKNPIHRYGIDRSTLITSGLSTEEVDRIYRSLFVYSVGFFELLKKILATTQNNYQIITTIWKVYQVLLEYCCKTDYRILIAEITDKHFKEMDEIERMFKAKIQEKVDTEKVLKQNMETMRDYNDQLEKDRANEKQLRLKLEEEYMQNTKNHEEEVKLRLKFEGKFNTMHDTHRELQIRHDRTLKELLAAHMENKEFEENAKIKQQELIDIKKIRVSQDTLIESLTEYKKTTQKELKKKNYNLMTAQQHSAKSLEEFELKRYEVQEGAKDLNDIKVKMDVQAQEIEHLRKVIEASKLEKQEIEQARLNVQNEYQKIKLEFEEREGQIENLTAELESTIEAKKEYYNELDPLRKKHRELEIRLNDVQTMNAENYESRKLAQSENKTLHEETTLVQEQIKKMNQDRHRLIKDLQEEREMHHQVERQRDSKTTQIAELYQDITKRDQASAEERRQFLKREQDLQDAKKHQQSQIEQLSSDIDFLQINVSQLTNSLDEMTINFQKSQQLGREQAQTISEHTTTITDLSARNQEMTDKYYDTHSSLTKTEDKVNDAQHERDDAILSKIHAEEISKTYKETAVSLKRQMKEERERCKNEYELIFATCKQDNERDMMHAEETVSRYVQMEHTLKEALQEKQTNRDKISNYDNLQYVLNTVETYRDQLLKELNEAKGKIDKIEHQLTDKEAEITNLRESHQIEVEKTSKEHKLEVNALEQKISKERIANVQQKQDTMKKQREDQHKITELQQSVRKLERAGTTVDKKSAARSPLRKGHSSIADQLTEEKGSQTDAVEFATHALKKKTTKTRKNAKFGSQVIQSQGNTSVLNSMRQNQDNQNSKESLASSSIQLPSNSEDQSQGGLKPKPKSGMKVITTSEKESSEDEDDEESEEEEQEEQQDQGSSQNVLTSRIASDVHKSSSRISIKSDSESTKKATQYMQWLVDEERKLLLRIEKAIDSGENVHKNQLKIWRSEMRIPGMFVNIQLTDEQLRAVEERQKEQVEYVQNRALRMIEEGSEYSSDFEEIEKSDYVSTDGEGFNDEERDKYNNIKVIRGSSSHTSAKPSPRQEDKALKQKEQQARTGEFGKDTQMSIQDESAPDRVSEAKIQVKNLGETRNQNQDPATISQQFAMPGTSDQEQPNLRQSSNDNSVDGSGSVMTASDKIFNMVRAQSARHRKLQEESQKSQYHFKHEVDQHMPVTQYLIQKNEAGKDVYKRRVVVQTRVEKQRDEEYLEKKARALSARDKRVNTADFEKKQVKERQYKNMFANFAENYAKTLEKLVKQSKEYMLKKAEVRKKPGKNADVDNIIGRERHHFLIQQMKESSSWQIHLAKLKEELGQQEGKWDKRDEEKAEIERKREEIRMLEEEYDRERSKERREKMVIVREDLRIKAMKEESKRRKQANQEQASAIQNDDQARPEAWQSVDPPGGTASSINIINVADQTQQNQSRGNTVQRQQSAGGAQQLQMQADMEQLSVWSEDQLATALSQHDAQNPQGEEEEIKSSNELQIILQTSQQQRSQALLDQELQELTKGGVAAVNRESQQMRANVESQMHEIQASAANRAREKDMVLMQKNMAGARKPEEQKKKPAKLGPSTIRTLIRAADSRKD